MNLNNIKISEDGYVHLSSIDKDGRTEASTFFMVNPAMSIETHISGPVPSVPDYVQTANRITIHTGIPNVCYTVTFNDRATMELSADDLRRAMMDSVTYRNRPSRRDRLRSVEMILLNPKCMPTQGTEGSAGYDCFADIEAVKGNDKVRMLDNILTLEAGQCVLVPLGFKLLIGNPDYEARLVPRSGKGHKGLVLGNLTGTIDSDYEGIWHMSMWNRTAAPLEINLNEAICQMVFDRVEHPRFMLVDEFDSSKSTDRGDGGFGSTDAKRILAKD